MTETTKKTATMKSLGGTIQDILSNFYFSHDLISKGIGKRYRVIDLFAVVFGIIGPFAAIAFPTVVIWVLAAGQPMEWQFCLILLYVLGLKLITALQNYFNNEQLMSYFKGRVVSAAPMRDHVIHMDFEALESKEGQEKLRAANECVFNGNDLGIETFLIQFPKLVLSLLGFLLYTYFVFQVSVPLLLFMLTTAVVFSGLNLKLGNYWNEHKDVQKTLMLRRKKAFQETADQSARGDMILYQMKDWLCERLNLIRDDLKVYCGNYYKIERQTNLWLFSINLIRDGLVYYLLIRQVMQGTMAVGTLLLLVGIIAGYNAWMQQIFSCIQQIGINSHTVTNYRAFLAYGALEMPDHPMVLEPSQGHEIRFEGVSYCYEGAEKPILTNINLCIRKGEKLALVGANGAGKTTFVKLMTGLYKPTSGKVFIDGIEVTALSRSDYFKAFSVVFQEMNLYAATIAQNVACSMTPDRERVIKSLMDAGLWEKVSSFEKGIDQPMTQKLTPEGIQLSGGQTQKLMLARALYQDAPVLVLDEPTAALDPIAESEMYETYSTFAQHKTSLFISHRLSSTRFCDRVCFLKDGQFTEIGTHDDLMALNGDYATMFDIQSKYYVDQEAAVVSTQEVM